jgi:hypothetical protein
MSVFLQTVVALGVVVAAGALVVASVELGRLRGFLATGRIRVENIRAYTTSNNTGWMSSRAGFAIYVCREGDWFLEADFSSPGYEPVQPTIDAAFDGQVVKKESGLKKGA